MIWVRPVELLKPASLQPVSVTSVGLSVQGESGCGYSHKSETMANIEWLATW